MYPQVEEYEKAKYLHRILVVIILVSVVVAEAALWYFVVAPAYQQQGSFILFLSRGQLPILYLVLPICLLGVVLSFEYSKQESRYTEWWYREHTKLAEEETRLSEEEIRLAEERVECAEEELERTEEETRHARERLGRIQEAREQLKFLRAFRPPRGQA